MIKKAAFVLGLALSTAGPAIAQEYPWCLQYDDAQHCSYATLQQCLTDRQGLGGFCNQNSKYFPVSP